MAEYRKRGRPRVYVELDDTYAKTGIIRKPLYLLEKLVVGKRELDFSSRSEAKEYCQLSSPTDSSAESDSVDEEDQSSPSKFTGIKEPVSKVYISVEGFKKRGPKPGQKRNKYKKHRTTKTVKRLKSSSQ